MKTNEVRKSLNHRVTYQGTSYIMDACITWMGKDGLEYSAELLDERRNIVRAPLKDVSKQEEGSE